MNNDNAVKLVNDLTAQLQDIRTQQWELHKRELEVANQLAAIRHLISMPVVKEPADDKTDDKDTGKGKRNVNKR